MENDRAILAALVLIGLVLGANFIMYVVVRSAARPGRKGFLEMFGKTIHTASRKKDDPLSELRRRIQELEEGKKPGQDS